MKSGSDLPIQEIYIDIRDVVEEDKNSNAGCGDCSSNVSGDLYIKRGVFDTLKRKTCGTGNGNGNGNVINEFNSLQRNSIHSCR